MTTALTPFDFQGAEVRVVVDPDTTTWFVAADIARVLGYSEAAALTRSLDFEDEKGLRNVQTLGGEQMLAVVNEAGLYSAIVRSRVDGAKKFRRWVTHEVLPAIRKTGGYQVAPQPTGSKLLALAVMEAQAMLTEKDERIAELEPKAQVADRLLDATGDLSVADAAKALRSRAGVPMGQNRLFSLLDTLGWIHRGGDGRWHAKQTAIDTGRITVLPTSHYHPRTGELVLDPPQIRITPKGLQYLLQHLTASEIGAAS